MLAQPRANPFVEGDDDVSGRLRPGVERSLGVARGDRDAIRVALERNETSRGFDREVGGRCVCERARLAEGADGGVDERRVPLCARAGAESSREHVARFEGLNQHIGVRCEFEEPFATALLRDIEHETAFAQGHRCPVEGLSLVARAFIEWGQPAGIRALNDARRTFNNIWRGIKWPVTT